MTVNLRSMFVTLTVLVASLPAFPKAQPTVFIEADSQFSTALAAAIQKKHVAVTIVLDPKRAEYTLKSAVKGGAKLGQ
jgi:hypothetical protein